jgi:uncharacterized protein YbgA (DUF1722 family)
MNDVLLAALKDWRTLNHHLHEFREDQVLVLLEHEKKHSRRINVLERLHARYNSLRVSRERAELLGGLL